MNTGAPEAVYGAPAQIQTPSVFPFDLTSPTSGSLRAGNAPGWTHVAACPTEQTLLDELIIFSQRPKIDGGKAQLRSAPDDPQAVRAPEACKLAN